ncbi:MAG: HAD-IIIA family hydrolase [Proteobacteria bacterium]|nr:HAD-IIIA family hydrolase [Pseudomonadota bacterium]NBS49778.1 HAD-IIIA family hydrolase [Verrucomicrobiota bacterium]
MPPAIMGKTAVFLDRDDTLIENVPYLGDPEKVTLLPGVSSAIAELHRSKLPLIVISNQSGVGRGLITKEEVRSVDARMEELLGGDKLFTHYGHCYAAPGDPYDDRRKPSPKMLQEAAVAFDIDLKKSFMVGNRWSDIQAGNAAGCKTILLNLRVPPEELERSVQIASFTARDWSSAKDWILEQSEKMK